MTDLDIYNPAKVRAIVEGKDARIEELEREVTHLREVIRDAKADARADAAQEDADLKELIEIAEKFATGAVGHDDFDRLTAALAKVKP